MKAILFDMDGVILDSMSCHVRAWKEAFEAFGLKVKEETLYLYEGAIEPENAVELFCNNGCIISVDDFSMILDMQKEIFKEKYKDMVAPFPEIPHILMRLNQMGVLTALVTSSHRDILGTILPLALMERFDHIVTGDMGFKRKPHPDPYLRAMEALGIEPHEGVAVENAPAGIESAQKAGARCVAITTTLPEHHLSAADIVVHSHLELMERLNGN